MCDANCTVSVDGKDIGTVPCNDSSLNTSDTAVSNKVVVITATDELGDSRQANTTLSSEGEYKPCTVCRLTAQNN